MDEEIPITFLLLMLEVPGRQGTVTAHEPKVGVGANVGEKMEDESLVTGVMVQRTATERLTYHP